MTTIKEVEQALLERDDIADKTKAKYVKKFKTIIEGCNNSNFIQRFNDTDYIINVYLKNKSARTIETYVGEIMAIHYTINLLEPDNLKTIVNYRDTTKRANEKAIEEAKKQNEVIEKKQEKFVVERDIVVDSDDIEVYDTSSESSNDYGFFVEEPEIVKDTLRDKKIALKYEIEELKSRLTRLSIVLEYLEEV